MTEPRNSSPQIPQQLLDHCRQLTISFTDTQLAELFENAGAALLDFAERAESNAVQGRFFEAMNELQQHRADVEGIFRQRIEAGFIDFRDNSPSAGEDQPDSTDAEGLELTLVSPEEIEESVAVENLTIKGKSACASELYSLCQRLAALTGRRRLKVNRLPGGPHALVDAYRTALTELDVEIKAKIVLYALFDKFVIKQAQPFYQGLNTELANAGVLPDLKLVRPQSGQRGQSAESTPGHQRSSGTKPSQQAGADTTLGAELFNSVIELMSSNRRMRHAVKSGDDPRSTAGQPPPASPRVQAAAKENLFAAIETIQTQAAPKAAAMGIDGGNGFPNIEVDGALVDRVKHVLRQERAQILQQVGRDKLSPMDDNLIDLIGMLFEYMLNAPILPNSAKALLSRLHTPYLKLALIDQRLLVAGNHPARQLLNQMAEAGSLWVDEKNPTRGIFPAMKTVVDRVLGEFKKDASLFSELLQFFERAMEEQQRRASTMEQRTREAARGREKLLLAKQQATTQIRSLTHRHALPGEVSGFLLKTWLDNLVFILLRDQQGENGEEWKRAISTAEQLVDLFEPGITDPERAMRIQGVPELRDEINLRVQRMGSYSHGAVDALLTLLDDPQAWHSDAAGESSLPRGLPAEPNMKAAIHTGRQEGDGTDETGPSSSPTEAEAAMIERLSKLRPGTWFELTANDSDQTKRIKLSWISPLTSSCMFVDKSGIQAETKTLRMLAQEVLSGQAKVVPRPKAPFIDRALISIRKILQRNKGEGELSLEA